MITAAMVVALFAALSGGEVAVLITAVGGFITGIGGLIVGWRGQNRTEKGSQLALLLEGYDEIVANLHTEITRMKNDLEQARIDLMNCKSECAECEATVRKLQATVTRLQRGLGG